MVILLNPPLSSYCNQININSVSWSTEPIWAAPEYFFNTQYSSPPSLFSRHGGFPPPPLICEVWEFGTSHLFCTWSSLPPDYLIISSSLWKSQHKYQLFRGTFLDFSNSCTTHHHILHFMLCYLFHNTFITWNYFILLFIYSLSFSFLECNIIRGGIR